ncbi:piggyBac transposable element-derived protein 3 [Nephila pilipes]|uniref:PiggyBac transposable element-derived protein 3 n=1 Tax=Nephila pilipes TaxID=299642 RepID=A0A8X6U815_NEPPI|nr:piggyBac transposable element-derived protein 3 [Nephila pilipes]
MKRNGHEYVDSNVRYARKSCPVKWFDNRGVLLLSKERDKLLLEKCRRWSKRRRKEALIVVALQWEKLQSIPGGGDHLDRCISSYRMKHRTKKIGNKSNLAYD